ncbi:glycosyltransferase [Streptomyces sp. P17]|uniref:glycosyltransferase n=1 Tax=Streptomyces sp. P17 TaxID=3074716 RepID=UPI0028F45EA1|nr:glycosyltransferase [Streptomyces sp. P17]MDT9696983.1 glycosyltransferase [Streptomyces sp. P17]
MRVVFSTYGTRGSVEPIAAMAVRLRELGAKVRVCAPPDEEFAQRLAGLGLERVPAGRAVRPVVTMVTPGSAAGLAQRAAELIAARDQPYWAGRVADLGIGAVHDDPSPSTESLSTALKAVLTPETQARATAVAGTIRTDGATVAAKLLLDGVGHGGLPVSA